MIQKSNSDVIIDLSALSSNIDCLKQYVQEGTRVMAVIKADAYGHGAVKVAKHIQAQVEAFAVNDIHEGVELREHGITKPILVFAVPEPSFASQYRVHNLTATVSAAEHFDWLPSGTSYHLNFDTGMGRLGFLPGETEEVVRLVNENTNLICTGIYSHFATASDADSEQVLAQHEMFDEIRSHFSGELAVHIANTGGTVFYDTEQFNMVRLGIGMYGYPPGETGVEGLKPVMQWKSRLVQVKEMKRGKTVSYGARWHLPKDGYVGVIPVGYDDGLKRSLTDQITARIDGTDYDVVGTVTMNFCMVYLGDTKYLPGKEVALLYDGQDAKEWAQKAGTIPYEILTSINPKIPRTYI